ncbi:hypothetical protein ACWDYJ_22080 [Streptomyces sp. NPDC003042]
MHGEVLTNVAETRAGVIRPRHPDELQEEVRIATALRELEAYGYLERTRVRTDEGRLVTRTVSYNRPRGTTPLPPPPSLPPPPPEDRAPEPEPQPEPVVVPEPVVPVAPPPPAPAPTPQPAPTPPPAPTAPALQEAVDLLARLRVDDARLLLRSATCGSSRPV